MDTSGIVTDVSNEGLNPDSDGDNNPGNNNIPTAVTLRSGKNTNSTNVAVSIQGGISPNNDGINDNLVISGISATDSVSFKIFDRWGELIFKTDNYKLLYPGSTEGWTGVANTGIRPTKSETRLPDGTYFYRAESPNKKLWDSKPYINFITIAGGTKK
ncbi:MAG: gliding motility-associated-like protein [Algoriphagus sp.]